MLTKYDKGVKNMKTMDSRQTMFVLSIALLMLADYSIAQQDIGISTGIIWQVKPYYYKEGNETKGIIAESFKLIKSGCKVNKTENVENLNETVMLDSLKQFYDIFRDNQGYPYEVGILKDVTSLSAKWLPVIQEFDKNFYENRSMTEKTLFTEPKTAVVVKRDKISLFYKLSLGILQTKHILVLSFLSAIIFAILVWFAVS